MESKPKPVVYEGHKYTVQQGYYRRVCQLHRRIWENHFGKIPDDHQIHHKNGIKTDNRIENLECIHISDHRSVHNLQKELEYQRCNLGSKVSIRKKRAWYLLKEGKNICSENSKIFWNIREKRDKVCVICGKSYSTRSVKTKNGCCSNACRCFLYRLRKSGLHNDPISTIKR